VLLRECLGHFTCVISGSGTLLVGGFMLFVDDDEAKIA
jgi:hypothetical protein